MRVRLVVEYDGSDFAGWQVQPGRRTVQGTLEAAIARLVKSERRIVVAGAGRTDAGVHAEGMVCAFDPPRVLPLTAFVHGLNALLPEDLAVRSAELAPPDFDPRRDARGKTYRYRLWNHPVRSPLRARRCWHVRGPLDLAAMREAAAHLRGTHDFSAFRAQGCEAKTTVRTLRAVEVRGSGPELEIEVEGTAFLRFMVRSIAGTLVDVGQGRIDPARIPEILASGDRAQAGRTAPAHGLTLVAVYYGDRTKAHG